MNSEVRAALARIEQLSKDDWTAIHEQAVAGGIGDARWEDAWLAASTGHALALAAQQRAIQAGASQVAAAAVAGAIAAYEAVAALNAEQYEALTRAGAELIGPGRSGVDAADRRRLGDFVDCQHVSRGPHHHLLLLAHL